MVERGVPSVRIILAKTTQSAPVPAHEGDTAEQRKERAQEQAQKNADAKKEAEDNLKPIDLSFTVIITCLEARLYFTD